MRCAPLLLALFIALVPSCGGSSRSSSEPTEEKLGPRHDLHCTPQAIEDELACSYRGRDCKFGPPLYCSGIAPLERDNDYRQKALAEATLPCTCSCEEDRIRCMSVP